MFLRPWASRSAARSLTTGFSPLAAAGKMMSKQPAVVELDMDDLEEILRRAEARQFLDEDYETVGTLARSYVHLVGLLKDKNTSIARLRQMIFGASTEKTAAVVGEVAKGAASSVDAKAAAGQGPAKPRAKGHGRNGAEDYSGAERIEVSHETLKPGDDCPECLKGTVYETTRPGVLVRITGQSPLEAKLYALEKLRCNLCGTVFTAEPPAGVGTERYDATAGAMIALLKYGTGLPFSRMERTQGHLGIPLPASTQWDIVRDHAARIEPALEEFIRQAADGDVLFNDDTWVKILELRGKPAEPRALPAEATEGETAEKPQKQRTGMFTSGIVATRDGQRIALFFSGRKHAGENLKDVLVRRAKALPPPIQMSDALSRNLPGELETVVANCLAHGRRKFVEVAGHFPEPCRHVLESLCVFYRNDAIAKKRNLSPAERLEFHQAESGPTMRDLRAWLARQFEDRLVEPNSALGRSITYLLKHWEKLTLFLRVPGAPLDNNICERALKKAILHRKNALFYKTMNGAHVGDIFMSLIHTCELCGANPLDYLTELRRHADELAANPHCWMPWNYRQTLTSPVMPRAG
jgi:transposase